MNKPKNIVGKTKVVQQIGGGAIKLKSRLSGLIASALMLGAVSNSVPAATLDVYVYTNTWAIAGTGGGQTVNYADYMVLYYDYYGNPHYRYYTIGAFNAVNIWDFDHQENLLQNLGSCNNIFWIDRSAKTAYVCSTGYNGSGNGTTGMINVCKAFSNGDLYIGGEFTSAGGRSNTSYFSCYRQAEGWSGTSGIFVNGAVDTFSWDPVYVIKVEGSFTEVHGPAYSGGPVTTQDAPDHIAYWHDYYKTFPNAWWTTP